MRPNNEKADALLGRKFKVLDHGFVSLVDYMGADACIDRAARVSHAQHEPERTTEETRKLIRYLKRHVHTSPFEMVELKFHCKMPIFVARQWIRHRTASVNEISGRYSLLPSEAYVPELWRKQATDNKQGSCGYVDSISQDELSKTATFYHSRSFSNYEWMCANDVARELARIDLPLSTYTEWYWKIDLHNLMHFLSLRVESHAQWEIQQYGRVMAAMLKDIAPLSYEAWIDYDVCGERMSRMEMEALRAAVYAFESISGVSLAASIESGELLGKQGLFGRELAEFFGKLEPRPEPDFTLDGVEEL